MADKTRQTNVRLPDLTRQQLEAIAESTGLGQTQIIILAISRFYEQLSEITPKPR